MKRRVVSLLIVACILATAFIGFSIPASADYSRIYVTNRYHEEVIELTNTGGDMIEIPFSVYFEGYYIIQVFGCPVSDNSSGVTYNGYINELMVIQGSMRVGWTQGIRYTGYGQGQLVSCYLTPGDDCSLLVDYVGVTEGLRLSFTYTDGLEYNSPPNFYDQIYTDGPGVFEFSFNASNGEYAQVACVYCGTNNAGSYLVTLGGGGFEQAYVLDPRSSDYYDGVHLWEGDTAIMYLDANVPYYIVVFIGEADEPAVLVDTIIVTLEFEAVE